MLTTGTGRRFGGGWRQPAEIALLEIFCEEMIGLLNLAETFGLEGFYLRGGPGEAIRVMLLRLGTKSDLRPAWLQVGKEFRAETDPLTEQRPTGIEQDELNRRHKLELPWL